jgi:hypothetical protein
MKNLKNVSIFDPVSQPLPGVYTGRNLSRVDKTLQPRMIIGLKN